MNTLAMTTKDLFGKIGKTATMSVENLIFHVVIQDVRKSYGRIDYLVSPMSGDPSSQWVSETRISNIRE